MPYFQQHSRCIFYREQGSGPILFILPGNTASSIWHQGELEYFGDRYRAISLDFPGTGQSDRVNVWSEEWWLEGARQAKNVLDHLGDETCMVMGTSGGAIAALLMAIHFPKAVKAVIADSCVETFSPQALRTEVKNRSARLPEQVMFWQTAHGEDWEKVVNADSNLLLRLAERGGDIFKGRLSEIQCPVLFTASLQDRSLPNLEEQICSMGRTVKNSRIYLTHSGDHPLMWSRADDFRTITDSFLNLIART
jgi:pimeloyl-ACP methyl ester carboxylesterase